MKSKEFGFNTILQSKKRSFLVKNGQNHKYLLSRANMDVLFCFVFWIIASVCIKYAKKKHDIAKEYDIFDAFFF